MERLQWTPQKYKESKQTTPRNYTPIKWTTQKKWVRKVQSPKIEPRRNRKYEQTNHKY